MILFSLTAYSSLIRSKYGISTPEAVLNITGSLPEIDIVWHAYYQINRLF